MVSQNTHSKYCNKPYIVTRLIQKLLHLMDLSGYLKRLETITRIKVRIRVDTWNRFSEEFAIRSTILFCLILAHSKPEFDLLLWLPIRHPNSSQRPQYEQ